MRIVALLVVFMFLPGMTYGQNVGVGRVGEDLPQLNSSLTLSSSFNFKVATEAKFIGYLVGDKSLPKLDEEDKWQVSIYEYIYKFENASSAKMKVLFSNRDVLISPLIDFFKDYSITLEPGEIKTIRFMANTRPQESYGGGIFVALWSEEYQQWFVAGGGLASLYVPRFNAFYQRMWEQGR